MGEPTKSAANDPIVPITVQINAKTSYSFLMVGIKIIYFELQLNKANTSDTEAPFLDLHLSISNGFVSSKIYDKRDDYDFDIVNFPFFRW